MKRLPTVAMTISLFALAGAHASTSVLAQASSPAASGASQGRGEVRITRAGSQSSVRGPAEWFTGSVRVDPLFPATAPSRMSSGSVTFEPGARSAWHTHPVGQVLIVTAGMGWIQREGGPVEEMRPGDVVWIPPGLIARRGVTGTRIAAPRRCAVMIRNMHSASPEIKMNPTYDFKGQVALVTGAGSGMGLATANAFAEAGATVVLADSEEDAVKAAAQKPAVAGHKAIAVTCDVSDDAQVAAMMDRTVAEFGHLDAAFNNVGVMARVAPTADSTREEWHRIIGTNLRGV
jgi:quercetin dioxygenase-like cupin family protein